MITKQDGLLDFLAQKGTQFVIPVYQRPYSWTQRQCDELYKDIVRAGKQGTSHFMSMVLFRECDDSTDELRRVDIIDGQQRIATMTILLAALKGHLAATGASVDGLTAADIEQRYLKVAGSAVVDADDAAPANDAKIQLLSFDLMTLESVINGTQPPAKPSIRVINNYVFFSKKMAADDFDLEVFWAGLKQLLVIDAQLDANDKAQAIFESLNTKGIPLTTADLVRNYLLVGESREEQERLYNEYWNPIELMFGEDRDSAKLNAGIRMWLDIRYRKKRLHRQDETYNAFKEYMTTQYKGTVEELLDELRSFCLMWAENFKFNEAKVFRTMDWAKDDKPKNLLPSWGHQSGF